MSLPARRIAPPSWRSNPAISRSVVVFPDPEGPSRVKKLPVGTSKSTPATASTEPYALRRSPTSTSAASGLGSPAACVKRSLQDLEAALEVSVLDHEGDVQADHVAVEA